MARNPAAETAAFVKAPDTAAATVRAAKAMAITRSTNAAIGELILLVTEPILFFTVLLLRGARCPRWAFEGLIMDPPEACDTQACFPASDYATPEAH